MKRVLQATIVAVIAAVSAGCTTVYTPAAGEPTARLRLVASPMPMYGNAPGHAAHLWVRDLSACPAQPMVASTGNEREKNAVSLNMPAPPPDAEGKFYTELVIPANKLLGLVVSGANGGGHWRCEARTRFRPAAGMDYEVEARWSADEKKCFLEMHTLTTDDRGVARRKPFVPLDPDAYGLAWMDDLVLAKGRTVYVIETHPQQRPPPDLCELPAR